MHEPARISDPSDVDLRGVAWGAALVAAGIVVALLAAWLALRLLRPPGGYAGPNAVGTMRAEAPRLEPAPQTARAAYDAEKARLIDSYGWVDRKGGVARIPVEHAMRVMADRTASQGGGR